MATWGCRPHARARGARGAQEEAVRTRELEQLADALTKQVARQLRCHLGWLGFSCATRGQTGDGSQRGAGQARCRTCKKRHSTASWTAKPVLLARGTRGLRHVRKARAARRPARPRETVAGGGQDVQCGVCSDEEKLGSRPTTMRREKLSFSPLQDKRGIVQNDKGSADCEGPWRHRQYGRRGGCTSAVPCGRAS